MLAKNYSRKEQKTNFLFALFIFLLWKLILNLPNYLYYKPFEYEKFYSPLLYQSPANQGDRLFPSGNNITGKNRL